MNVGKHIILQYSWLPTGIYHEIIYFKVEIWQKFTSKRRCFFFWVANFHTVTGKTTKKKKPSTNCTKVFFLKNLTAKVTIFLRKRVTYCHM